MKEDYKKNNIMLLGFPKEHFNKIKKNRKEDRVCDICEKAIRRGEVYFSNETVLSYWVDAMNSFHIGCLQNDEKARKCCLKERTYNKDWSEP